MVLEGELLRLLLVLARVLPSALALTAFSQGAVPRAVAGSLALALTAALTPLAGPLARELDALALASSLVRELAIGSCFALALALALLASAWAVRLTHTHGSWPALVRPLATAYLLAACWLVLSLGGLRAFVIGLAESFRDAPLAASAFEARAFALGVVQLGSDALASAVGFGLPLIASVWLLDASLALLARMLPGASPLGASPLRAPLVVLAAALLLMPISAHAPELVRAAIASARALTRTLAR